MQSDNSYHTTPQAPIHSGFGPNTTAREVLRGHDLRGKTALVTGGYSGIGLGGCFRGVGLLFSRGV
jgi:hypothetical protein